MSLCTMEWKETRLYSILNRKCPFCHEGDFFVAHPYNLARAGDTYDRCGKCGGRFSMEPGFYYGAMYVSYAFGTAVCVAVWLTLYLFWPAASLWTQIGAIIAVLIISAPWLYATSKITWANLFFKYRGTSHTV
jgi:hypothetical protein